MDDIAVLKYNEALELPKFKASLDRLLNKPAYDFILATHHISREELQPLVDKAISEGNAVLVQREYCGYFVVLWKD
jgi:hypothetical protein